MPDRLLTIGELARRTGIASSALRYCVLSQKASMALEVAATKPSGVRPGGAL